MCAGGWRGWAAGSWPSISTKPRGWRDAPQLENPRFVKADVTEPPEVQAAIEVAKAQFGRLDGVVQCAGIMGAAGSSASRPARFGVVSPGGARSILIGTFNVLRLAAAAMSANRWPNADGERGVIVNTASVAAFDGQIGQAAYAASKGGVASLTLPAARELARFGIRVVAIAPGVFETPMMAATDATRRDGAGRASPLSAAAGPARRIRPALVRQIMENPMLNGSVVRLDGACGWGRNERLAHGANSGYFSDKPQTSFAATSWSYLPGSLASIRVFVA